MRRRKPHARYYLVAEGDQADKPPTRPTDTKTEGRRLIQDERFRSLLAELRGVPKPSDLANAGMRELRLLRLEYLNTAAELEAIAHSYRIAERDLRQQIITFLGHREAGLPSGGGHRGINLVGWLQQIRRRDPVLLESPGPTPVRVPPESIPHTTTPPSILVPASIISQASADVAARILGPLELVVGGRRILRWHSFKAKTLLQYFLINEGRPVRRDVLMELQWPDHTYNSARNNLNVAVSNLRNTLQGPAQGAQPILYRDGCYLLNPELKWWIDRSEFRSSVHQAQLASRASQLQRAIDAYQHAVELYRGPLFEEEPVGQWFLAEQHQLKEMYLQALERLAEIYYDAGELSAAVRFGQLAITVDRCRESTHRILMRCFAQQHQQQLVCRQYRSCVTALHDDLGVQPGDETARLFRKLTSAP